MSVYREDAFQERVNYAAQCFMRGTPSTRHFDTCFEMFDGDLVVTALVRRCEKNEKLKGAIARRWADRKFPQDWIDTAAKYADVPTRKLADKAAEVRAKAHKETERWLAELEAKRAAKGGAS